jgi:hypothetical protein
VTAALRYGLTQALFVSCLHLKFAAVEILAMRLQPHAMRQRPMTATQEQVQQTSCQTGLHGLLVSSAGSMTFGAS